MPVTEEVGEEEGKGNGIGCSPEGEHTPWVLCLEACISLLQAGISGEVSGGFSRYSSVLQVRPPRAVVSTDWSVTGQGGFSHCNWFWYRPPGFAAFLGLELTYNWGLDVISREERPGEERLSWGRGPCFPSFAPARPSSLVTITWL